VHVGSADWLRIWDSSCARSSSCLSFRRLAMLRWYGMRAWSEMMVGGIVPGNGRGETFTSGLGTLLMTVSTSATRFRGADRRGVLVRFVPGRRSEELDVGVCVLAWITCRSSIEFWRVKLAADSGNNGSSKRPKIGAIAFPSGIGPLRHVLCRENDFWGAGFGEWKPSLLRKGSSAANRKCCPRFSKLILEKIASSSSSPPFSLIEMALLPMELLREELELLPFDLRRGDPAATLARLLLGVRCTLDRWAFGEDSEGTVKVGLRLAEDMLDVVRSGVRGLIP
jgi:hypothetical protein